MRCTRFFGLSLALVFFLVPAVPHRALAQDDDDATMRHGRKYKPPPETAHIEVLVEKGFNKKPIMNAAVIFHPIVNGHDEGTLEIKSGPDGKASIDVIPVDSHVLLQVLADGFATYAQDFQVTGQSKSITVDMQRPRAQLSAYTDNQGKPEQLQPGLQEPIRPKTKPASASASNSAPSSSSGSSSGGSQQQ